MMPSILRLKEQSDYNNTKEYVLEGQKKYPKDWVFRPIGVEFEITNKCNLQCEGCAQQIDWSKPEDTLTQEQIIQTISELGSMGVSAYSLTGGEAFMFLPKMCEIISSISELDIYKLNTNGYRFVNTKVARSVLRQLRKAGFGRSNKAILPVMVISLGQQTKQGVPMQNAIYLIQAFIDLFGQDDALLSINVTDRNIGDAITIMKQFKKEYKRITGMAYDDQRVPIRTFGLTNMDTLNRLGIASTKKDSLEKVTNNLKRHYKSWRCLNTLPDDTDELPTLTPRVLIRPNGDVYACPGFNYVHRVGSLHKKGIKAILADVNNNKILSIMFTQGLPGLIEKGKKLIPGFDKQTISISASPCDICQVVSKQLYPKLQS